MFTSDTTKCNDNPTHLGSFAQRPTWSEIDLDALAANFAVVRQLVKPQTKVMAVVKADAYGHGAVPCARRLAAEGADWFGVAMPEEAVKLRRAAITQPILCLGGFWEGQEALCIREGLAPVVYSLEMIAALDRAAREMGTQANVHLKVDTGMGRLGVRYDTITEFAEAMRAFTNIRVEGVMTHFAAADDPALDSFTGEQISRFTEAIGALRARGFDPIYEDLANSAGVCAFPSAHGNLVRPGGMLYGLWRDVLPPQSASPPLRPVMALRSRIMLVKIAYPGETLGYGCTFKASRRTLVATLPIGYEDGYTRALSNCGRVIVRNRFAPVVGRVSMDLTLIDVTDIVGVAAGDTVTLIGEDGGLSLPAEEVAKQAGTISYEITCGISARVPRYYLPTGAEK